MLRDTCILGKLQGSSCTVEPELLNPARAGPALLGQLWRRLNCAQGTAVVAQKLVCLCSLGCISAVSRFWCWFLFSASFSWGMSMLTPCELSHEMLPACQRSGGSLGHCALWARTVLNLIGLSASIWGARRSASWLFVSQLLWHGQC